MQFDAIDRKILGELQRDADRPIGDIAAAANLSTNACWRRIKRLEEEKVISGRVALLDPAALGLHVTVFVAVKTSDHSEEWLERFARGVHEIPEVVEFYRMSGDVDYLLKILVPDIAAYDRVYRQLIKTAPLFDVSSSFAMERIKSTTMLPLPRQS
jgi:Lrp/AsnC family transcriptional regulator